MAAPPGLTMRNLNGIFTLNKRLSQDLDALLTLQGLSWLTRKAISFATVTLTIREYSDANPPHSPTEPATLHIDITSNASGLSTTTENRTLDWTDRAHSDKIFGNVRGRSRLCVASSQFTSAREGPLDTREADMDGRFLRGEILADGTPSRLELDESVQSFARNVDEGYGWTAEQMWNVEVVNGQKYYTRRVVCRSADGARVERVRLVYDYKGGLEREAEEAEADDGLAYGDDS